MNQVICLYKEKTNGSAAHQSANGHRKMLVTILPFFLAARVLVDDDPSHLTQWHVYGGECVYDVVVNMSLSNTANPNHTYCSMVTSELKCRPKGSDSLSCHFANARSARPGAGENDCSQTENFVLVDRFVDQDPFEIRFNAHGIENLVVRRSIPRWRLDMIKVIVSQLHLGFGPDDGRAQFTVMENSTVGYCEVDVRISRSVGEEIHERYRNNNEGEEFELFVEPARHNFRSLREGVFRVEKIRYPKRCPRRSVYFFGNHEDHSTGNRNIFIDMTSSTSNTIISSRKFFSYTTSRGLMKTPENVMTSYPYQRISLFLRRIDPARDVLPAIPNPASTSLYAYSRLKRSYGA